MFFSRVPQIFSVSSHFNDIPHSFVTAQNVCDMTERHSLGIRALHTQVHLEAWKSQIHSV
jgi:hypothetical protein